LTPRRGLVAALLGGIGLFAEATAAQDLRAEEITPGNAAELLIGGPDAIGGVGDTYLANDVVELVVDHPSRRHAKLNHGGTIVDLGLRDRRGADQFARLIPLVNMSQRVLVNYDAIRTEIVGQSARIVVSSSGMSSIPRGSGLSRALDVLVPEPEELADVRVETVYELRPGESFVRITTRFENAGGSPAPVFAYGDLWMRGGRSLRAFLGNSLAPELARGFQHWGFSRENLLRSLDALAPFSHVAAAGLEAWPPVAYALFSPERTAAGRSFFGVTDEHVSFVMAFAGDPGWRELSALRVLRVLRQTLPPGGVWQIERRLLVSGGPDVGSLTDVILPALGVGDGASGLSGHSLPEDVRTLVHVHTVEGHPVTQLVSRSGRYAASLPPGAYRLTFRAAHRASLTREVRVEPGAQALVPEVRWAPLGVLALGPAFADGGPGRIVFRGRDGTPDPVFGAELLDFRLDGEPAPSATETSSIYIIGNRHDPTEIRLPAGRYTLVATRGPEYDVDVREVEIRAPGERVSIDPFELARVASLPEHVSADLHVHAQASDDSGTTNASRLRDFVASGVLVLATTDHDHVADYDQALAALDLGGRIHLVRGVEVTSSTPSTAAPWTIAHHNAWPVSYEPHLHRRGAPPSQDLRVPELYSLLRSAYAVGVVQLNHPRCGGPGPNVGCFFTHQATVGAPVDTRQPVTAAANASLLEPAADGTRALDFDLLEVMNGESWSHYLETRQDFHWLLRQGYRRTATANSDTHGPDELAGMPRNYVGVGSSFFDARALDEALRAGRSFGTTGPLILRFGANGGGAGDTVSAPGGRVRLVYDLVSAPWVPVDEVRLLVNGEVVRVLPEGAGDAELVLSRDAFLTLEAGAPLGADPASWIATHRGLYTDVVAPGFLPAAFSNPIYVDVDGDGAWTPPGLAPAPRRAGPWLSAASVLALLASAFVWRRRVTGSSRG
jgi:hypothetical protein